MNQDLNMIHTLCFKKNRYCSLIIIYHSKYNLLSPYNVAYIHVFKTDALGLDNQLVCSPLEDYLSHSQLYSVVCSSLFRVEFLGLFIQRNMLVCVLLVQVMFGQSCW